MALMRFARLCCCCWPVALLARRRSPRPARPSLLAALREGRAVALMRHATRTRHRRSGGASSSTTARPSATSPRRAASRRGRPARACAPRASPRPAVYSSQWCRCLETARLLDLGEVLELPALNSFFGERARAAEQTAELAAFLRERTPAGPLILVTHQVNISAFTDAVMRSGEIVVVALPLGAEPEVLGRIAPLG